MSMLSVKTHPKLAFGLLVIVAAGMAGLLWWLIPTSGGGRVDALAVIEDACSYSSEVTSYDATERGTFDGGVEYSWVAETRVNNMDSHTITYDEQGLERAEVIYIASFGTYTRYTNEQGEWGEWVVQPFPEIFLQATPESNPSPGSESNPSPGSEEDSGVGPVGQVDETITGTSRFCGWEDLVNVRYVEDTRVNDTPVKHFSASIDPELIGGGGNYENYEYWVDEDGGLIQFKWDVFFDSRGGRQEERATRTVTASGHGEPNVITAPVALTPTPTSTSGSTVP